jgi:hypothetical protein
MTTFSVYSKAGVDRRLAAVPIPQLLDAGAHTRPGTRAGTIIIRRRPTSGDGITVRALVAGKAQNGEGDALTAESRAGDLAILIMAAQLQGAAAPSPVPDGWAGTWQDQIAGTTRSGYVATRKVTSPTDTRGVEWWVKTKAWTARQRAVLAVIGGVDADRAAVGQWSAALGAAPAGATARLLVSAAHGTKDNKMAAWTLEGGAVVTDGLADVSTTESWSAVRVALGAAATAPDGAGANPPAAWAQVGLVAKAGGGAGENLNGATVPLWFGGEATRAGVSIMPYGARSASALKGRKGVVVGHRGMSGAGDVVEHTMAAYTRAVECGVDALEISCHRTSDGVWLASHDSTLARLGGPSTPIRDMTWAQVQAAFAGRPEATPVTLKDYLATYGATHVTIFDPKTEMARSDEYLALLKDYKDRVVIKAFADSGWLFAKVKQAGWATWGYAYARNQGQPWWAAFVRGDDLDFLSMEWDAPQAIWSALVAGAPGRPIISHIPATAGQVATGASKGAAGCITSRADLVAGLKV